MVAGFIVASQEILRDHRLRIALGRFRLRLDDIWRIAHRRRDGRAGQHALAHGDGSAHLHARPEIDGFLDR